MGSCLWSFVAFAALPISGFPSTLRLCSTAGPPKQADRIIVVKSERALLLMSGSEVLKTYKVALVAQPLGAKDRQGNHKTPERIYSVDRRIPNSQFHKALHLSYPSAADRERARQPGVSPGGDVELPGLGAPTNEAIDEICPLGETGIVVEIRP